MERGSTKALLQNVGGAGAVACWVAGWVAGWVGGHLAGWLVGPAWLVLATRLSPP